MSDKALLQPTLLGGAVPVKNRIALAPMTRARAGPSLIPNEIMKTYYVQRASAGLLITEGTFVNAMGRGWVDVPGLYTQEMLDGWKTIVDAVHEAGGVIFAQLWHCGRASHSSFHDGKLPFCASAVPMSSVHTADYKKVDGETPRAMTVEEIQQTTKEFVEAAKGAIGVGFDGVEVHSANGYLLDEFLQEGTNLRSDDYGGSFENRFRFTGEVLDAVAAAVGAKKVGVRFSPNGVFGEVGSKDYREMFSYVIEAAGRKDLAYVHVVDGLGFGFHEYGEPFTLAEARKLLPDTVSLIGNCGYTLETAEAAVAAGDADMIAIGRPYISTPDLPERHAKGQPLNPDAKPEHYFSPKGPDDEDYAKGVGYIDYPTFADMKKE